MDKTPRTKKEKILGGAAVILGLLYAVIWLTPTLEKPNPIMEKSFEELKKVYDTDGGRACLRWAGINSGQTQPIELGDTEFYKKGCKEHSEKTAISFEHLTEKKAIDKYSNPLKVGG